MKLLIENFKRFLHENGDPMLDKLVKLVISGRALQAFELASSIDNNLMGDLLVKYGEMWNTVINAYQYEEEPEWVEPFAVSHDELDVSETKQISAKIKEHLDLYEDHYDDYELSKIYDLQDFIGERIKILSSMV